MKAEKALVKARLQAQKEWEERSSNFAYGVKKELLALAKRIDPLEMVAVGSLTVLIQPIIFASTEILGQITSVADQIASFLEDIAIHVFWKWFGMLEPGVTPPKERLTIPEYMSWMLAFVIAFIIVRHPEVMTEMFSGATKLTGFALGLLS